MDEELTTETTQEQEATRVEQRIRNLNSEKAKLAADKEELAKAKAEAEAQHQSALKDAEFYKNFNTTAAKYNGATEYQDRIREKVMAGYDLEDATISILAKEGKLSSQTPLPPKPASPAGGSATTTLTSSEKSLGDMTQVERKAQLMEAERRGDIGLT